MTDSFLAGTICHTDIGRKIGEMSSGGGVGWGEGWGSDGEDRGSRRWWQR